MRHFTLLPHRRTRHRRRSCHTGPESLKRDPVHAGPWRGVGRFPLRGVPRLLTPPGQTWWIPCRTNFIRKDSGFWCNLNLQIISPGSRTRDFTVICRYNYQLRRECVHQTILRWIPPSTAYYLPLGKLSFFYVSLHIQPGGEGVHVLLHTPCQEEVTPCQEEVHTACSLWTSLERIRKRVRNWRKDIRMSSANKSRLKFLNFFSEPG